MVDNNRKSDDRFERGGRDFGNNNKDTIQRRACDHQTVPGCRVLIKNAPWTGHIPNREEFFCR